MLKCLSLSLILIIKRLLQTLLFFEFRGSSYGILYLIFYLVIAAIFRRFIEIKGFESLEKLAYLIGLYVRFLNLDILIIIILVLLF